MAGLLGKSSDLQKQMVDWCSTAWYKMAQSVAQNRRVIDICEEFEKHTRQAGKGAMNLLPLHELIPGCGDNAIGTMLMFKKVGV
jgi:hypothetical protein